MTTETTHTITVWPVENPADLHTSSGPTRERAWLMLDLTTGHLWCQTDYDTGATPVEVHYGDRLRWEIPPLTARAANHLMAEVVPLAQRIMAGATTVWIEREGRLFYRHDADSEAAQQAVEALTDPDQDWPVEDQVQGWRAEDWLRTDCSDTARELRITADTTDERLDEIAEEVLADAQDHGVIVIPDLNGYLRQVRDDVREDMTQVQEWAAGDWLSESVRELGITADTTDADLDRIAGEVLSDAEQTMAEMEKRVVIVIPDLDGYLRQVRDELLDAREYVLDELNDYDGDNVWGEVILRMDGYDEAATEAAYQALVRNPFGADVVVIGGTTYHWDQRARRWAVAS